MLDESTLLELEGWFEVMTAASPGHRQAAGDLDRSASGNAVRAFIASWLGEAARPVRMLLLDKRDGANWSLGWHQDRTIAVRERRAVSGFTSWTRKSGLLHVEPPIDVLERMVTARIHLDPVDAGNAPLLIAPGSHRLGRIAEGDIANVVARCGIEACFAARGDVWFYATPILHASARAYPGQRRRVVQVDFAADPLPGGLQWTA